MDFWKTLKQLKNREISELELINEILNKTQKDPERIKMYVNSIEEYLNLHETDLETQFLAFLKKVFKENLTIENTKDLDFTYWQRICIAVCQEYGYKSIQDIPSDELNLKHPFTLVVFEIVKEYESGKSFDGYIKPSNKNFFEFYSIYYLRDTLIKFIEPKQESQESPKKKQAKNIWGLLTRFEFLKDLKIIENIQQSVVKRDDQNLILMQVLGCSYENAKKLINGTYQTSEVDTEQLDRQQLINKIKQAPMR